MNIFKKLAFLPFYYLTLATSVYLSIPILTSSDSIFTLSPEKFLPLVLLTFFANFSALFFVLFGTFALNWKIVLPASFVAALIPFLLLPAPGSLFVAVGVMIAQILTYVALENSLKLYYTFNPIGIFNPLVKKFILFLLLAFAAFFFLSTTDQIRRDGFSIPDELLNAVINIAPGLNENIDQAIQPSLPQIQLNPETLDLVKQYPELLSQYGIDPQILESIDTQALTQSGNPQALTRELTKNLIKDQFNKMVTPYLVFLPPILTLLFFFSLQSVSWLVGLFIPPVLWLVFYIFEKTGVIKFVVEQRPVKKMMI